MKRFFDIFTSLIILVITLPLIIVTIVLIKATSRGPVLYFSQRVGKNRVLFFMPKFRTMLVGTPQVATHLLQNPSTHLTLIGGLLRKLSIDELPQLLSVLSGDMSLVGPRPALFNQDDLVALREKHDVNKLRPGITGWAQINGRDDISIPQKVDLDAFYVKNQSFYLDLKILFFTFGKVFFMKNVTH